MMIPLILFEQSGMDQRFLVHVRIKTIEFYNFMTCSSPSAKQVVQALFQQLTVGCNAVECENVERYLNVCIC